MKMEAVKLSTYGIKRLMEKDQAGYHFGTEYSNLQINEALNAENPREHIPHEDVMGHGTFLASVACRNWRCRV